MTLMYTNELIINESHTLFTVYIDIHLHHRVLSFLIFLPTGVSYGGPLVLPQRTYTSCGATNFFSDLVSATLYFRFLQLFNLK